MKNRTKIILLLLSVVVFACGLKFWADNLPTVGDNSSSGLDPEIELAFDFAFALQMNDPRAYEIIAPNLKPRLDQWMNSHKSQVCVGEMISSIIWDGTNLGKKITLDCFTEISYLSFEVDDIVITDLKVTNWGAVREGH
ncbi:MAG: hypothetical protein IT312_05655 [Anaerolineales bacterium]|nr:hypothetical protein [Anaerolineales bacterium]